MTESKLATDAKQATELNIRVSAMDTSEGDKSEKVGPTITVVKTPEEERKMLAEKRVYYLNKARLYNQLAQLVDPVDGMNHELKNLKSPAQVDTVGPQIRISDCSQKSIYRPVRVVGQSDEVSARFRAKFPTLTSYNNIYIGGFMMYIKTPKGVLTWDAAIHHQASFNEQFAQAYIRMFHLAEDLEGLDIGDEGDETEGSDSE